MTRFNLRCGLAVATALALFAVARADDPAASYARVVQMLKDEFKEEKIIRLVQESPTKFTLGAGQIAELKKLGASDRLIQAMQQNGPADVGKSDTRAAGTSGWPPGRPPWTFWTACRSGGRSA